MKKLFSLALILGALALSSCGASSDKGNIDEDNQEEKTPITYAVQPEFATGESRDENIPLYEIHTDVQKDFLNDETLSLDNRADGKEEKSFPQKYEIKLDGEEKNYFELSLNENFEDSEIFETSASSIELDNLFIASKYYYRSAISLENLATAEIKAFQTSFMAPRNVRVDGVTNFRDLGGWVTVDGKRTKQGLIYRCGRFNTSGTKEINKEITEEGEKTLLETLKIKTEVDLRNNKYDETGGLDGTSSVVEELEYKRFPFQVISIEDNKEVIKEIFDCLSDQSNYPLCFHCNIGTDRTGMISMLYNGVLGVPFDSCIFDYAFSNFGLIGGRRTAAMIHDTKFINEIKAYNGETFKDKCEAALLDIGVTSTQIENIRNLML